MTKAVTAGQPAATAGADAIYRKLFDSFNPDKHGRISHWEVLSRLQRSGLQPGDPRIAEALTGLKAADGPARRIHFGQFKALARHDSSLNGYRLRKADTRYGGDAHGLGYLARSPAALTCAGQQGVRTIALRLRARILGLRYLAVLAGFSELNPQIARDGRQTALAGPPMLHDQYPQDAGLSSAADRAAWAVPGPCGNRR
jgi:hypothetical protein